MNKHEYVDIGDGAMTLIEIVDSRQEKVDRYQRYVCTDFETGVDVYQDKDDEYFGYRS
jgi:hypothetical protein